MIDSFMSWSITTLGMTILFIIALVILALSMIPDRREKPTMTLVIRFLALFVMLLPMITFLIDSQEPYIKTTTEWRTIYTNDIDAQVELSIPTNELFGSYKHVTAGSELGRDYNAFESTSNSITIRARKNDTVVGKTVKLPQENIIVNGQLNEHAKIIKIEYRETTKEFRHQTNTSNEIKVTIDGTKTEGDKEELEKLFK